MPSAFAPHAATSRAPFDLLIDPAEALELPPPWHPPSRPPVPLLASVVPILGAVALWLVTGSVLSLWLAALGPLIAGATLLDAARGARRDRRRAEQTAHAAQERVRQQIHRRHVAEREHRWARHPDVAAFAAHDSEIWRPVPGRNDVLTVGSGVVESELRVRGGGEDAASAEIRARAGRLESAPIVVPVTSGIAVTGSAVLAAAVVRALVAQAAMILPPGELRIVGPLRGENCWAGQLPHRRAGTGLALAICGPDEPMPEGADIRIVRATSAAPRPPGCAVVLSVQSLRSAQVDCGGEVHQVAVEAIGRPQALALAEALTVRAAGLFVTESAPEPVALGPLLPQAPLPARGSLPAVIGTVAGEPCVIDLVTDGPHAVVAGVTGSGKSELLITWILALCATHTTEQVSFLLADFKGGTAFDALAGVAHVTGVLTDLDGTGARRAIESLRAEVRWRETELARVGARDVCDPRVALPRLVIVIDEFAALLGDHPELHAVFTDVAARGRALGMHLILGTQRPSGVVRESLLTNCPLRISLRVTDPADSRALIGADDAALLPGGADARGVALVRAAGDRSPRRVRIALSADADREAVITAAAGARPRRPWLPDLPLRIDLEDLAALDGIPEHTVLVGLADEPQRQRQRPVGVRMSERGMLIVGTGGSGKSTALRVLAAQAPRAVVHVGGGGEQAWDAVAGLLENAPETGTLVLIDDLDAVASALPPDYARELLDRVELCIRGAGQSRIFVAVAAQRLTGGVTRIADLLPRRLVLGSSSRAEHIAAGADPAHYAPGTPPGRGRLDGISVQVAMTPPIPRADAPAAVVWRPHGPITGFVMRRSPRARAALAEWEAAGVRVLSLDDVAGGEWTSGAPVVIAGEADEWQRNWRTLGTVRADHDLIIDASCGPELRLLTGERGLPPYCEVGRARAWLFAAGGPARRITLPGAT